MMLVPDYKRKDGQITTFMKVCPKKKSAVPSYRDMMFFQDM